MTNTTRTVLVLAATSVLAASASSTSRGPVCNGYVENGRCYAPTDQPGPDDVPVPALVRGEKVITESAIADADVIAEPVGAMGWTLAIRNTSATTIMIVWDESSLVASNSEASRLVRGETRMIDAAKAQPPTPVPPGAIVRESVFAEKLADIEKKEADMVPRTGKFYSKQLVNDLVAGRARRAKLLVGGSLNVTIQADGGKRTWIGRIVEDE